MLLEESIKESRDRESRGGEGGASVESGAMSPVYREECSEECSAAVSVDRRSWLVGRHFQETEVKLNLSVCILGSINSSGKEKMNSL